MKSLLKNLGLSVKTPCAIKAVWEQSVNFTPAPTKERRNVISSKHKNKAVIKMILLTGGAGYIGSHICVELIKAGYKVVIADDLSNSHPEVIEKIERITGVRPEFEEMNICDKAKLSSLFSRYDITAAVHLAGKKAVGESVKEPLSYYRNNLDATITLIEVMRENHVNKLVFSSSATVYDAVNPIPYLEDGIKGSSSPYGWTKVMGERIMKDVCTADKDFTVISLRYFNPVGAHESGLIGEEPQGVPNNLMPYIAKVASGELPCLNVFGNDYPTVDGSGVRDYIHVCDLAEGHVAALSYAENVKGFHPINLGRGKGVSVLELVSAFEKANDIKIPYVIKERRAGDIAEYYADASLAGKLLGWKAKRSVEDMCRDSHRFEKGLSEGKL